MIIYLIKKIAPFNRLMSFKKPLVIMKFGGLSLENSKSLRQTLNIVEKYLENSKLINITSVIKGVTDKLIHFYNKKIL